MFLPARSAILPLLTAVAACQADAPIAGATDHADCESAATLDPYDPQGGYAARSTMIQLVQAAHPLPPGLDDHRDGILLLLDWEGRTRAGLQPGVDGRLAGAWAGIDTIVIEMFETLQQERAEFPCHLIAERADDARIELDAEHRARFLDYVDRLDAGGDAPALQRAFYDFYSPALAAARIEFGPAIEALAAPERRFVRSFASLAILLGDMNYPLTGTSMTPLIETLPSRVVASSDYQLFGHSDLPPRTRAFLLSAVVLSESGAAGSLGKFLRTWLDDARAPAFHAVVRETLAAEGPADLVGTLADAARAVCDRGALVDDLACAADLAAALAGVL